MTCPLCHRPMDASHYDGRCERPVEDSQSVAVLVMQPIVEREDLWNETPKTA